MLSKNFEVTHSIRPQVWHFIFAISILTIFKIWFRFRLNPTLKIEKIFPQILLLKISTPPSYAILESKNRLHRISIFACDFVQICPEKLMKNFRNLIRQSVANKAQPILYIVF
nr:MAG TPA: hypothetical protein [Bacteriophage sp.]